MGNLAASNTDNYPHVMLKLVTWFAAYIILALWSDFIYQHRKGDPVAVL